MRKFKGRGRKAKSHRTSSSGKSKEKESSGEPGRSGPGRGKGRSRSRWDRKNDETQRPRRAIPVWSGEVAAPWPALLSNLTRRRDQDLTVLQILDELSLGESLSTELRFQVAFLEKLGLLHHHRRGRVRLHARDNIFAGALSIPAASRDIGRNWGASGSFGFVRTGSSDGDLYIPSRDLAGARHGDQVLARENPARRGGRTQGSILAILKKVPSRFTGIIDASSGQLTVRPRNERLALELPVRGSRGLGPSIDAPGIKGKKDPADSTETPALPEVPRLKDGDLVIAEAARDGKPQAVVIRVLGPATNIASAEEMVILDLGLPGPFPEDVEAEAARIPDVVSESDLEGRVDFRSGTVITIDPAEARDFDDAISCERLKGGGLRLWVHIADVGHYVKSGSALDREAYARGCSIYLPGRVIPMLPHGLSSGICSLKPGVDRLVQSAAIDFDRESRVTGTSFADGVIRSAARLTYEEAAAILDGGGGPDQSKSSAPESVESLLQLLAPLARRLTKRRFTRGSLDLDLPEIEMKLSEEGTVASLHPRQRTDAHRLVEEFMLSANEAVARALSGANRPSLYRVHDEPDPGDVQEVEDSLQELKLPARARRGSKHRLQQILDEYQARPEAAIIGKLVLRAMKQATYADKRSRHFGLALDHYLHFTSPIRRYPDLVVHRTLRQFHSGGTSGIAGVKPEKSTGFAGAEIAAQSSRLERRAVDAERAMNDLQVAHHLRSREGERFEGRVSGKSRGGIFIAFEGPGLPAGIAEGFAQVSRPAQYVLTEPVGVFLERVDLLRGRLRLRVAGN